MDSTNKIAVIGMAGRFPGANNIDEYWNNLISGKDTIKHFTDEELSPFEINYNELKKNPNFVPARGILEDIDKFDASFFGYSPNDAALTDPQHRVWLETTWKAFENAGCDPFLYKGAIGVYAGGYTNTYLLNNVLRDRQKLENYIRLRTTESFQIMTANDIASLPTKTAYNFNLKGPAINVQTACSTSLVAIAQACNSLYSFESDICIAGGVCILSPQESGYIFQEGAIPSPDGHCRPFDAKGQGTVFSNGVGVVVLKRLEDAIAEQDNIIAVVDGWALNNDGNKKVSYTAPSVEGQSDVITAAQDFANISAEDIGYIEAHGTATKLGDPIEIAGLTKAFSRSTNKKQFCGIGSVKSNIGHTDAAAGVASFIKLCLIAKNRVIPPSLHYTKPNPFINFANTPFYVVDKLKKWDSEKKIVVGVSSFGIGGTNAHIIVEEPPFVEKDINNTKKSKNFILPLSAKSKKSLENRKAQLIEFVNNNPETDINDLAFTLWKGRSHMKYRASVVVPTVGKLLDDNIQFNNNIVDERASALAFMFPGQGAQYYQMGKELYYENSSFKTLVDKGFEIFQSSTGVDLKAILFDSVNSEFANKKLAETAITQPALFIIEYCLAKILIDQNINPQYLIGHSIGEYTAACIAGVFDYETCLKIVTKRGELMQNMPTGEMYVVLCSKEKLSELESKLFEVATQNTPTSCAISFATKDIVEINDLLDANDIQYLPLNTSHAFHSKAFEPILEEFASYVDSFSLNTPNIPVISCLTGEFLTAEQAISGKYWSSQLRNPVLFYSGIKTIVSKEQAVFIEVGPNGHLSSMFRSIPEIENKKAFVLTLGRPDAKYESLIVDNIIGSIWASFGKYIPELNFLNKHAKKIELPSYPFEQQTYWIEYDNSSDDDLNSSKTFVKISEAKETSDNLSTEDILAKIWKDSLGIEELSVLDNFFYVGGTSLLAISIVDKAKDVFEIDLILKNFFDAPTIHDFAEYIDSIKGINKQIVVKKITKSSRIISGEI